MIRMPLIRFIVLLYPQFPSATSNEIIRNPDDLEYAGKNVLTIPVWNANS